MLPLFAPIIVRWSRKRLADFGLDRRGQDRALRVLLDAVDKRRPADPARARRAPRARRASRPRQEFKVHLWLLATLDGELCLGPDRGGQTCLVSHARLARRARAAPARGFARRAGAPLSCAPTGRPTSATLARWAGLPLRDDRARARADRRRAARRRAGERCSRSGGRRARGARAGGAACSAPTTTTTSATRAAEFAARRRTTSRRSSPAAGIVRPTITVDGRFVGTWSSKRSRQAARGVDRAVRAARARQIEAAIEAEVDDIGRFEGLDCDARVTLAATIPRR